MAQSDTDAQRWADLKTAIFQERTLQDGAALVAIDLPYRAEDAAVVPVAVHMTLPAGDGRHLKRLTLVIDGNPSPLAATFTVADNAGTDRISTRVRVDDYTMVHAVAELSDGKLYVVDRYVKAAGGCSAPAATEVSDNIPVGAIRVHVRRPLDGEPAEARDAQIMVHHPNYSGMQMNQITRLYVPAYFVHHVTVSQAGQTLMDIDSNISISQNPEYRFDFRPVDDSPLHVQVVDSDEKTFAQDSGAVPPS